jgi:PDGLE domain
VTRNRKFLLAGLAVAVFLAAVVSFYASSTPDGLEKVAADTGINANQADHPLADAPFADYGTEGVKNERLSGALAGIAGVVLTLVIGSALFIVVRRRGGGSPSAHDAQDNARAGGLAQRAE